MRVYHFVNREFGLEDLRLQRIKIATLNDLNDPFELFGVEFSQPSIRYAFRAMKNDLAEKRGLLCFSKNWHNPVQWSHYADRHRGICLGFDVPNELLGEVSYSRKRLVSNVSKFTDPAQISEAEAKKFLFTKYSHWSYEQEVRCFVTLEEMDLDTGLYFANFGEKLRLRQVIVGAESNITRDDMSEILSGYGSSIEVFKSRLAFKTFRVVKQRKESLWV